MIVPAIFCMFVALSLATIAVTNWAITSNEGRREGTDICGEMASTRWFLVGLAAFFAMVGPTLLALPSTEKTACLRHDLQFGQPGLSQPK